MSIRLPSARALAFWVIDLCTLYQPLKEHMTSRIGHASSEPLISYSMPTEWTRNLASTRSSQNRTKCALRYHPRKFSNISNTWDLPLRYKRYFAFWDARAHSRCGLPRAIRCCSTASGWTGMEKWALELKEELDARLNEEVKGHRSIARIHRFGLKLRQSSERQYHEIYPGLG